jgi:hypothetical protein
MTTKRRINDYKYINILISNNTNQLQPADYFETKREPLFEDIENWEIWVGRFKVPLFAIPLFKFVDGRYSITITFDSNAYHQTNTQVVTWVDNVVPPGPEHWVWYYQHFVTMVNTAISTSYDVIKADLTAHGQLNLDHVTRAPYFMYDSSTKLFSLIYQVYNVGNTNPDLENIWSSNGTTGIANHPIMTLSLNGALFNYFNGFNSASKVVGLNEYDHVITVPDNPEQMKDATYWETATPPDHYQVLPADYPCLFSWHRLSRIIFSTNLPIYQESYGTNITRLSGQSVNQSILTDFEVSPSDQINREYLYFFNTGKPRYINFSGFGQLKELSISVYAEDNQLNSKKLMLPPDSEIFLKFQCRRRSLRYKELELIDDTKDNNTFE